MTFTFRPAKRENVPLLLGVAGGTGSGKTMSALRLARGLADGQPFAGVDTENRRMNHYADLFPELRTGHIEAPFRPGKYADAILAAVAYLEEQGVPAGKRVIVVDSASHEWAGDGGCLDWHDEIMGGDQKKNLSAWIEPKRAHKAMVTRLLQVDAHVILAFRAEPKVEAIRENGQTKIVPKASLTGLDGWLPISEKMLPYELTASFLLMADAPGVPKPIKLQEQHRPFVPLDRPLDEQVGRQLAAWAAGSTVSGPGPVAGTPSDGHAVTQPVAPVSSPPAGSGEDSSGPAITAAQKKKADVLVGQLRDGAAAITTEQLYTATGRNAADYIGDDGQLHWSELRDSLSKAEAHALIDRLERFAAKVAEGATA